LTVHNLAPHDHPDGALDARAYQRLAEQAALIHHHCPCSAELFKQRYHVAATTPQIVVAHGHYEGYPNTIKRLEARRRLGIPAEAFVYLHFGQVRGYKGFGGLLKAFARSRTPNKFLLAAGQVQTRSGWKGTLERVQLALHKRLRKDFLLHGSAVANDDVHLYLNAADCMVLGHTSGLNSGVAVLGMTFGRLLIGPTLGCIDWVLAQGRNERYEAGNWHALAEAMDQVAKRTDLQSDGDYNKSVAQTWNWDCISRGVLEALQLPMSAARPAG
jgi:beta-1,4-mannosyltransferase